MYIHTYIHTHTHTHTHTNTHTHTHWQQRVVAAAPHGRPVSALLHSSDGHHLWSSSYDGTVRRFDYVSGVFESVLQRDDAMLCHLALAPAKSGGVGGEGQVFVASSTGDVLGMGLRSACRRTRAPSHRAHARMHRGQRHTHTHTHKHTHTHTHTYTGDILVVDPRSARVAMEIDAHDRKIATVDAQDAQVCITRASSMSWRVRARSLTSPPSFA